MMRSFVLNYLAVTRHSYQNRIESLDKPYLIPLDSFSRSQLPLLLRHRNPSPFITKSEPRQLMQWKLTRGKWRPWLMEVTLLDEDLVESASRQAFGSLPDLSKAVSELTVLKGVGPATASAALAPDVAPFMSDEAMIAALGNSKDYTLKQYLVFAEMLQSKSKELSIEGEIFTASDVVRTFRSAAISSKVKDSALDVNPKASTKKSMKRKRKS